MKVSFYTPGCKVNQYETESLAELFSKNGYSIAGNEEQCDVFVINSCTVTAESDRKARQMIRRFRKMHPKAVFVLIGCMPQAFPEMAEKLYEADVISGNTNQQKVFDAVQEFLKTRKRIVLIEKHQKGEKFNTPLISDFATHTRAFMKIQDGCERYCTYCIIPFARGNLRSKSLKDIKTEACSLARAGYKEIVLVGINLTSFGKDTGTDISSAVSVISEVEGIKRIRLGSVEPDLMDDALLKKLAENEKFCPQFHLSLQSGSDETLKRMNRHYDSAFYYDLVCRIRRLFDNPSITTDIMVGFAGETEEEFLQSLDFARRVGFAKTHIFCYSQRKGTVAASLKNQVVKKEKERRSRLMNEISKESERKFLDSQIGAPAQVLFETQDNGIYSGYTKNYTLVKMKSEENLCGKIVSVRLETVEDGYIKAKLERQKNA
ncbi:MAG: tRNA (N(6)-L-threonylcarbamoyladenosine(37)-C(2))-methylthiotransferase MtaB [Clostridiales bacterium]|nr:tRNA (N(6)-L-threonylcarbamoyladenosine(37)-C(2))-methylthiotransferase MtaB [Candidatus Equinaster intestinalis]